MNVIDGKAQKAQGIDIINKPFDHFDKYSKYSSSKEILISKKISCWIKTKWNENLISGFICILKFTFGS